MTYLQMHSIAAPMLSSRFWQFGSLTGSSVLTPLARAPVEGLPLTADTAILGFSKNRGSSWQERHRDCALPPFKNSQCSAKTILMQVLEVTPKPGFTAEPSNICTIFWRWIFHTRAPGLKSEVERGILLKKSSHPMPSTAAKQDTPQQPKDLLQFAPAFCTSYCKDFGILAKSTDRFAGLCVCVLHNRILWGKAAWRVDLHAATPQHVSAGDAAEPKVRLRTFPGLHITSAVNY